MSQTNRSDNDALRLAVLIDADNVQSDIVQGLMDEIANYGTASVKRIYGNWTTGNLGGWKDKLLDHSIQPIQQFAYTQGKNATDSAMIIDAMDLLYTKTFDGFCIVSSDSDFTRLASRIRESGLLVYGFGESKTPSAFSSACDKFIYLDLIRGKTDKGESIKKRSMKELRQDQKLMNRIRNAIQASSDDAGWANLGPVGSNIVKHTPQFDPRNYGYQKLGELIAATKLFDIEHRPIGDSGSKQIYVRIAPKKSKT